MYQFSNGVHLSSIYHTVHSGSEEARRLIVCPKLNILSFIHRCLFTLYILTTNLNGFTFLNTCSPLSLHWKGMDLLWKLCEVSLTPTVLHNINKSLPAFLWQCTTLLRLSCPCDELECFVFHQLLWLRVWVWVWGGTICLFDQRRQVFRKPVWKQGFLPVIYLLRLLTETAHRSFK